jgi:hypothetical protein
VGFYMREKTGGGGGGGSVVAGALPWGPSSSSHTAAVAQAKCRPGPTNADNRGGQPQNVDFL